MGIVADIVLRFPISKGLSTIFLIAYFQTSSPIVTLIVLYANRLLFSDVFNEAIKSPLGRG